MTFWVRYHSQTLVVGGGGLMQKGGPLKFLTLVRGALKKITNLPVKIEFTCLSTGLTHNFHGKKGGAWNFWRSEEGSWNFFCDVSFLHQVLVTSDCKRSLKWVVAIIVTALIWHQSQVHTPYFVRYDHLRIRPFLRNCGLKDWPTNFSIHIVLDLTGCRKCRIFVVKCLSVSQKLHEGDRKHIKEKKTKTEISKSTDELFFTPVQT